MGSMVGSWNMLVYGTAMFAMEKFLETKKSINLKLHFLLFSWLNESYVQLGTSYLHCSCFANSETGLLTVSV